MQIKRIIEVWEQGMEGALLRHVEVAETISTVFLYSLFAEEAQRPDPKMVLSYFLTADKLALLQPYVAEKLDAARYDYILSAIGIPSEGQPEDEDG